MSEILKKKIALQKQKQYIKDSLPHLYGFDWYPYQKDFLETTKEIQVLCCANQLGKSTVLCAKLVKLATDQELWKKLWVDKPRLFLYLLPNQKLHNDNAESKWSSVLPRNDYEDDGYYGWKWDKFGKNYHGIIFNNGVKIRFLSYGQNVQNMQSLTAHTIAFDEEPDWEIVPEVQTRTQSIKVADLNMRNAWGGFKMFAFTATKSQNFFREVLEERGPKERWPVKQGNVWKKTVSLYDCQTHVSGKKSMWTDEKIAAVIKDLPTEADIKRRVYGRFQASEALVYPQYSPAINNIEHVPPLAGYSYYAGIDYGSGGKAHPSAIVFVAVNEGFTRAYVTDVWVGDNGELTTCSDVIDKYKEMVRGRDVVEARYDWAAKDLHTFASRSGLSLLKANKDHKIGEDMLNVLFKNRTLWVCNTDPDSNTLCNQLSTFVKKVGVRKSYDDAIDALRYAVTSIPWDIQNLGEITHEQKENIRKDTPSVPTATFRDGTPRWNRSESDRPSYYEAEISSWGSLFK